MQLLIKKSIAIFILIFTLISCDPCRNLDCNTDNIFGQFRIISKTTGNDLVFGPNAIYDKSKIKFYTLNNNDTTFFEYKPLKFPNNGYDSILYVRFYPETTKPVYMMLSSIDTDTLGLTYNTYKTKCCGTITDITNFKYNNVIDIPGNQGTQTIKK